MQTTFKTMRYFGVVAMGVIAVGAALVESGCKKGEVAKKLDNAAAELPAAVSKQVQHLAQESGYSGKAEDVVDVAKGAAQEAIDKVNQTYNAVGKAAE